MSRIALVLALVVALPGCPAGRSSPPARSSAEMTRVGDAPSWFVARGRRGGTFAAIDEAIVELRADGPATVRSVAGPDLAFCVIGPSEAVVIVGDRIEHLAGGSVVGTWSTLDATGGVLLPSFCAATGADDIWVATTSPLSLHRWDGAAWSAAGTMGDPFERTDDLAVTARYVWTRRVDGVYRHERAGGAAERVAATSLDYGTPELYPVDDTRVAIFSRYGSLSLVSDDGTETRIDPGDASSVAFGADGAVLLGVSATDGRSESSFGGSTTTYFPDWAQAIVRRVHGADDAELAHATRVYDGATAAYGDLDVTVFAVGDRALVAWGPELWITAR